MGTKWTKRTSVRLSWTAGKKRKRGHLTANGLNATKYLQRSGVEHARHWCEMCGSNSGTWREKVVCLCDGCYKQLKSDLRL